jgi:hypothetical protein
VRSGLGGTGICWSLQSLSKDGRTRENRDRFPLCEQRVTRNRDDKRLTPSKLLLTQTCGERGEMETSLVIGNVEEAGVELIGEGDDRDVEEELRVLRW